MQNGVFVNGADEVTVDGFMARGYKANGFFFTNVNGYTMNHLIARQTGVYGLYAFNSIGGSILNSEAYYVNDGAFYIGQTPPQAKPVRTIVRNVDGWGSPLGFSATNMRYVTITKSRFYNNAIGLAPNALDSEKFPPAEENVIIDNDIFWNNFNFHQGKPPFRRATRASPRWRPIGTGIILLGGKGNRVENNRIYGNFLAGVTAVESILVTKTPEAPHARATTSSRTTSSASTAPTSTASTSPTTATAPTTASSMAGVTSMFPADGSTFADCGGRTLQQARAGRDARLDRRERAEVLEEASAPAQGRASTPLEVFGS